MKSMTGFASSEISDKEGKITIEARSENDRFLDIKFQIPEQLYSLETDFMELAKKQVSRWKVNQTEDVGTTEAGESTHAAQRGLSAERVSSPIGSLVPPPAVDRRPAPPLLRRRLSESRCDSAVDAPEAVARPL